MSQRSWPGIAALYDPGMKLLILGGTVFVGRALTDAALAMGHSVQHLNRGRSQPPDPRVQTLHADRTDAAAIEAALAGHGPWDAVIDTSGYLPQVVAKSAAALQARTRRYCFVSTISVYPDGSGRDETSPVSPPPDPPPAEMTMPLYGPLKVACENVVREAYGERAFIPRPGLIVGPHDPTDRFTYWPVRLARGGEVLAPGRPQRRVQFIDVRDLAEWIVAALELGTSGTFNATGPATPLSMGELLLMARTVAGTDANLQWVEEAFLLEQGVAPWKELPLWIPEGDAADGGVMKTPIARALAAGLRFRPLDVTLQATLEWARSRPADHEWKAGLDAKKETAVLAEWRNKS
jgi:2'-hydroxyisoflavone reductase